MLRPAEIYAKPKPMDFFVSASESHIKKERSKARELRRSQWWKLKLNQGKCHYCGGRFPREVLTMDHLIPVVRGGHSSKGNVVVACKDCNSSKKYMTDAEFRADSVPLPGDGATR